MKIGNRAACALWLLGGILVGFGVASLPSIGLFLLPAGVLMLTLTGVLGRGRGWPFIFPGIALPLLWVAWLHRGGPGERCWETSSAMGCDGLLDPRPWLIAGLILLLVFAIALRLSGARRSRRETASPSRS